MGALSYAVVNSNRSTVELRSVRVVFGFFGIRKVLHIYETETPGIARKVVVDDGHVVDLAIARKELIKIFFRRINWQAEDTDASWWNRIVSWLCASITVAAGIPTAKGIK